MTLNQLEQEGYQGPDANLATSLYDYGLAWKELSQGNYKFIYGVGYSLEEEGEYEEGFNTFDWCDMNQKDWESMLQESWFHLDKVQEFAGTTELRFPYDIDAVVSYYGGDNVFSTSYNPFSIER